MTEGYLFRGGEMGERMRAFDWSPGALVVGLNPYGLFDEGYGGFLSFVAGQIAGAVTSAGAYEEKRRGAEALAERDRAKTAFLSNASHEFRTPLTLMLGPLEGAPSDGSLQSGLRDDLGLVLRKQALAPELAGPVVLDFRTGGLVCTIDASLAGYPA